MPNRSGQKANVCVDAGGSAGKIIGRYANRIAPVDAARDFQTARAVGTAVFDCNFVLSGIAGTLRRAATLGDPDSGRAIVVETTQPGMQLFTGKPGAIALETQHFADSPNRANFPSTVLRPGTPFESTTIYRFGLHP